MADGCEWRRTLGVLREWPSTRPHVGSAWRSPLPAPPPGDALLQGRVVEHAAAPQDHLKLTLLRWRRLELFLVGLAHRLWHSYLARFRLARYSRNARTISPLRERSFSCADCFMPSATSAGMRSVILTSSCRVSMPLFCHHNRGYATRRDFWLKPTHASPLPLQRRGL